MTTYVLLAVAAVCIYGAGRWQGVRVERARFTAAYGAMPELEAPEHQYAVGDPVWYNRPIDRASGKVVPRTVVAVCGDGSLILTGNPAFASDTDPNCYHHDAKEVARFVRPREAP